MLLFVCLVNMNIVKAETFDKSLIKYPIPYLDWYIDSYKIDTDVDLSYRDIEKDKHIIGHVEYKNKTIQVSDRVKSDIGKREVIQHEIGHIVNKYFIPITTDKEFKEVFESEKYRVCSISDEYYCDKDINEFMAEVYMFYVEDPMLLKSRAPGTFDYMNDKIKYYNVSKADESLDINTNNINKRSTEDNKVIDNKISKYSASSSLLSEERNDIFFEPNSLYESLNDSDKCTWSNFLLSEGLEEFKINLLNESEEYIKETIRQLRNKGY